MTRIIYCPECNKPVGVVESNEPMPSVYHVECLDDPPSPKEGT